MRSKRLFEIDKPLGCAKDSNLAAMLTPSPYKFFPSRTTSPMLMPIRNSIFSRSVTEEFLSLIFFWKIVAHSNAETALLNSAKTESPAVLNILPLCLNIKLSSIFRHSFKFLSVCVSLFSIALL